MIFRRYVPKALGVAFFFACGGPASTDGSAPGPSPDGGGSGGDAAAPDGGGGAETGGGNGGGTAIASLVGAFKVKGEGAGGTYEGDVQITQNGAAFKFVRTVHYLGVTVEDGRELHWALLGDLTGSPKSVQVKSPLRRADFIIKRGNLTRSAADTPLTLEGTLTQTTPGELQGTLSAPGITLNETWYAPRPDPGAPLYANLRAFVPGHPAPSASEKAQNFSLYANYHGLDVIKPYVNRPEFQAAIHGNTNDKTDFDFYQKNPNALRVAEKVIDDISLAETLARANAYRRTLAQKATLFQADFDAHFMDPAVGMVVDSGVMPNGPFYPSVDAALWTGTYVAAQVYRYRVTHDPAAITAMLPALNALLTLQEITNDWTTFARTLRPASGNAAPPWHAGIGAQATLDWMEGGNNDMIKGLFYGYLLGYQTLCTGTLSGYDAYCQRIRTNAKHLADDVKLDQTTSQVSNKLPSSWLYAVVTDNALDRIQYQTKAEGYWAIGKAIIQATPVYYNQGTVDWSGTHLTFVGDLIETYLAQQMNLGGDAQSVVRAHIDASHSNLALQRFVTWHLLEAAYGSTTGASSPFVDDARWRLREVPYPKKPWNMDRRISPEFCMSPYPAVPWKQDWMKYPDPDRTQGLTTYPLFEGLIGVLLWDVGMDYQWVDNGAENTGADYLHLYWFARANSLIGASE
jgi:hypothetical protein